MLKNRQQQSLYVGQGMKLSQRLSFPQEPELINTEQGDLADCHEVHNLEAHTY